MKCLSIQYVFFLLLLNPLVIFSQNNVPVVTNVDLQQRTDYSLIVDIYYDVFDVDNDTLTVTMLASSNAGVSWNLTCNNITGAIGSGITNGTGKHIIWNVGVEHPNFFSDNVIVEISADDGIVAAPILVAPQNNYVIIQLDAILDWNASVNASEYILQVSEDSLFNTYIFNQSGLTNTNQQITGLSTSSTYYWRVSATNSNDTSSFSTWKFSTAPQSCPGLPTVTYSGKTYNTVKIGAQCWLKENLDVGVYVPSTNTGVGHSDVSNNGIIEKYCYENNVTNCTTYGGLYDWNEAMGYTLTPGAQGICPPGWHIPTYDEFHALEEGVSGNGFSLLAIGQGSNATNTSGFSALFSGTRNPEGNFASLGGYNGFWSSNGGIGYANRISISGTGSIYWIPPPTEFGLSIRCTKN